MGTKEMFERLRRFDAYPKTLEDFRIKTFGGATGIPSSLMAANIKHSGWGKGRFLFFMQKSYLIT